MRKTVIASIAVLAGYLIGPGSDAMAAPPQKLTDLKCAAGQTVAFDGALWACADFPGLTGLER